MRIAISSLWAAIISFSLALTACSSDDKPTTAKLSGVTMDSVVVDTTAQLTADAKSPKCRVRVSLQYARDGKNAPKLNRAIMASGLLPNDFLFNATPTPDIQAWARDFVRSYTADFMADYRDVYRQEGEQADNLNTHFMLTTETRNDRKDIVTYVAHIAHFNGGMHEVRQTLVRNFRWPSAKPLTLDSLFVPGHDRRLAEVLQEALVSKKKAKNWQALKERHFFADGKVYAPENFILGDDEITFIYNEDEVAPHDEGEIRLAIDLSQLKDILR